MHFVLSSVYFLQLELLFIMKMSVTLLFLSGLVLHSNGQAAVSFTLKFNAITWRNVLDLQLAMENGSLLGSSGVMDEASCTSDSHNCKLTSHFCEILFSYCVVLISCKALLISICN